MDNMDIYTGNTRAGMGLQSAAATGRENLIVTDPKGEIHKMAEGANGAKLVSVKIGHGLMPRDIFWR